jgi:hypothetical protein
MDTAPTLLDLAGIGFPIVTREVPPGQTTHGVVLPDYSLGWLGLLIPAGIHLWWNPGEPAV